MQCKDVQFLLANGEPLDEQASLHHATCAECASFAAFEARLVDDVSQWRSDPPSPYLRGQIRAALMAKREKPTKRILLWASGLAAATLGVVLLLALPQNASGAETAYRRMEAKVAQVGTLHMTVLWKQDKGTGGLEKVYELWWKPGAWREKSPAGQGGDRLKLQKTDGIVYHRYDPESKTVIDAREQAPQPSDFSLQGIAGAYMDPPKRFERQWPTPQTELIIATNEGSWSRIVFSVDPKTELPFHAEKQNRNADGWEETGVLDFEFNRPIPDRTFQPADLKPRP